MQIPQVSPWLGEEEQAAAAQAVADNWITEGPRCAAFSQQLNALMGAEYGVFAPNGTLALVLGLLALGIGPGDEVLIPDTTFIGSATAVAMVGATPVFVEVTRDTYQIDVASCAQALTPRTRAVMPVHLYGMCADMGAVMAFARQHGLLVIEDAAQALGVRYQGKHAGTFGDVGCFSFFADKTITTGEGGYVVCRDAAVHERLRLLRNQGRLDRGSFIHPAVGYNFRITDMQAAVGLAQLAKLDEIIRRKRAILGWYAHDLADLPEVQLLPVEPGSEHVPFRVIILANHAHDLMAHMGARGVQPRTFFYPLHRQPCFARLSRAQGGPLDLDDARFPNAIRGYERGVSLPVFPTLTREQVRYVCGAVRSFYRSDLALGAGA
ncbi:DegT/DnrJ/EryC1/StrS family aminotransferase [Chloroflexia bacterium SDU3-3]|nr:DegT/DnrJ/EryC1/StrS family aminotransferase [Chloroflexia bacterium SDU3-3]